jgi:pyruvate/2-oxoglutarate dehydrogenase complex dihydrolipoamide dehydrogenase (E3) component
MRSASSVGAEAEPEKMLAHKDATVKANVDGVAFLFKKNKIDSFHRHRQDRFGRQGFVTAEDGKCRRSRPRTSSSPPAPTSPAFRA